MDKKKLIGTIVGVVFFVALIAGATFAWLTVVPTITNGTATGGTTNFIVEYTKGSNVTGLQILDSTTVATTSMTGVSTGKTTVKAYRLANNADGNLTIKLITTSSNALVGASGPLRYAVCSGACTLTGNAATSVTSSTTGLLAKGTVTSTTQNLVVSDGIATSEKSYDVYLWLDQATIYGNSDTYLPNGAGLTYSGYISASAVQD